MADTGDYLSVYKKFFEDFAATVNPDDQLPVKVAGYLLREDEIVGEIVDWTIQYLNQKNCPAGLTAPIVREVLDEVKAACSKDPTACGYAPSEKAYKPLRLMQTVVSRVNEVCRRYSDNGRIASLPRPGVGLRLPISTCAIKNSRRSMEDRHVIIHDFHSLFGIQDPSPASYYAVFDGHAGTDAAIYSVSHLHQFLAESSFYPKDPVQALKDAFNRTDALFIEKSNRENLRSGTTVVCALIRPEDRKLYIAWVGDSQALLVRQGRIQQVVIPHKPDRKDERDRIEEMGGCVIYYGTWRVNGQLAVSRAIGDYEYKPYVCADPDVTEVALDGSEDFLILACDGLWDFVTEQQAAAAVYDHLRDNPDDVSGVSERLVRLSKEQGSTDNISVIVALLRDARDMDTGASALLHHQALQPLASLRESQPDDHHDPHDHDLGPETSVDDGEVQRQQLSDLDPAAEPRQEAPTPPAASLLLGQSEPDNVGDSGEDSEDEWNYYKVEPRTKPSVNAELPEQINQLICPETLKVSHDSSEDLSDMESRLNPDAAEFVPSPTHSKPSFEDAILAQSPAAKKLYMDKDVPSLAQFQDEICQRPGEVSEEDALVDNEFLSPLHKSLHNGDVSETPELPVEKKESKLTEQILAEFAPNNSLEVSEALSTKAEFGDDSVSLVTTASDSIQKTMESNTDGSLTEVEVNKSEISGTIQSEDFLGLESTGFADFKKGLDSTFTTDFSQLDAAAPISFEVQKEIAPKMEECPERVKLNDDLINPFGLEQPIAEAPIEDYNFETELSAECQKLDKLNESFEHNPNFTLDAYEVNSPLNPCAPSFDYQRLEDESDFSKGAIDLLDKTKSVEAGNLDELQLSDLPKSDPLHMEAKQPELPVTQLDSNLHSSEPDKDASPTLALSPEPARDLSPEETSFVLNNQLGTSADEIQKVSSLVETGDELLNSTVSSDNLTDQKDILLPQPVDVLKPEIPLVDLTSDIDKSISPTTEKADKPLQLESVENVEKSENEPVASPLPVGGDAVHSYENFAPSLHEVVSGSTHPVDISDIPAALRVCVYPLPPQMPETVPDDVEILSSPCTDSKEREEMKSPTAEKNDFGNFVSDQSPKNLAGEQKDMIETMLQNVVTNQYAEKHTEFLDQYSIENGVKEHELLSESNTNRVQEPEDKASTKERMSDILCNQIVEGKAVKESVPLLDTERVKEEETLPAQMEGGLLSGTPTPPPTPASADHDTPSVTELKLAGVAVSESSSASDANASTVALTATAAAVGVGAAVAAGVALDASSKKESVTKKSTGIAKDSKKEIDKAKPSPKTGVRSSLPATKSTTKTSPTSPTKPLAPVSQRTSTPKKPSPTSGTSGTPAATKPVPKVAATGTSKIAPRTSTPTSSSKSSTAGSKPTPPPVKASASARSVPKTASPTSKPPQTSRPTATKSRPLTASTKPSLTNGEAKPAEVKKTTTTSSSSNTVTRTAPRPRTAPPRTTAASKPAATVSSTKTVGQTRPGQPTKTGIVNGIASKPRSTVGTTGPARTASNNIQTSADKQLKETANKHISARRVGTIPPKTAAAKVGVKKANPSGPKTLTKTTTATSGSPVIATGAGDEKRADQVL